ncbi:MAG: hypothetical protein KDK39_15390 [Leptospiraceae bacterium]|nr:hypothetical protein [Leptospiraceae bacterium]
MPYMAVGSRQILFDDSNVPAVVHQPRPNMNHVVHDTAESTPAPDAAVQQAQEEHKGLLIDTRA